MTQACQQAEDYRQWNDIFCENYDIPWKTGLLENYET